jgi:hypothetical protein
MTSSRSQRFPSWVAIAPPTISSLVEPRARRPEPRRVVADGESVDPRELTPILAEPEVFEREVAEEIARYPTDLEPIPRIDRGEGQQLAHDEGGNRGELQQSHQRDHNHQYRGENDPDASQPAWPRTRGRLPEIDLGLGHTLDAWVSVRETQRYGKLTAERQLPL